MHFTQQEQELFHATVERLSVDVSDWSISRNILANLTNSDFPTKNEVYNSKFFLVTRLVRVGMVVMLCLDNCWTRKESTNSFISVMFLSSNLEAKIRILC